VYRAGCCGDSTPSGLSWSPDGRDLAIYEDGYGWRLASADGGDTGTGLADLREIDRLEVLSWQDCLCTSIVKGFE